MRKTLYSAGSKTTLQRRGHRGVATAFRFYGAESYILLREFMAAVILQPQSRLNCASFRYSRHFGKLKPVHIK